jgi:hypothetical protein
MHDIFGDLGKDEIFANAFAGALRSLWAGGVRATLQAYLDKAPA